MAQGLFWYFQPLDNIVNSPTLGDVDLRLKLSVVQWDPDQMQTATDMMNAGLKELEYDV